MNELQAILQAIATCRTTNEPMFLATVVNTQGSTYRKSGARMLMMQSGQMIGAISGGCLENDVYEHTQQRMESEDAIVVTYDTTADEDLVWGFGIGCSGIVQVLIERLHPESPQITFLSNCLHAKQPGVVATVFSTENSVPVGSRLMLSNGQVTTDIQEPTLVSFLTKGAHTALHNQQSTVERYYWPAGAAEVFIEVIQPPPSLMIFGAGRDALPVVQLAKTVGWEVTVIDCRASEATSERFTIGDRIILTRREALANLVSIDNNTIAVVMTHNYFDDLEALKLLLNSPARYIGLLGARSRTQRLVQDLLWKSGIGLDQLSRLHAPIGLDIGASTSQEIALAIVAEIQMALTGRSGQSLKDHKASIHPRRAVTPAQAVCIDGVLMNV